MTPTTTGFHTLDTYRFIVDWALEHGGNTPTQRQIAAGCGFSHATAHYQIQQLIQKGLLERRDGALCIVHAEVAVPYSAYNALRDMGNPDVTTMQFVPKEVHFANPSVSLADLGIVAGDSFDVEYQRAIYPAGWHFEPVETEKLDKSGHKTWMLNDNHGQMRGVLSLDEIEYRAKLYIITE